MCGAGGNLELGLKSRCPQSLEHALPCGGGGFRCSAHPAGPSELRFSELGFLCLGIMGVGCWLVGGWLLVVVCWLSLLRPLLGGLLEVCLSWYHGCWRLVNWWLVGCRLPLLCPLVGGLLEVCLSWYHGCWRLDTQITEICDLICSEHP